MLLLLFSATSLSCILSSVWLIFFHLKHVRAFRYSRESKNLVNLLDLLSRLSVRLKKKKKKSNYWLKRIILDKAFPVPQMESEWRLLETWENWVYNSIIPSFSNGISDIFCAFNYENLHWDSKLPRNLSHSSEHTVGPIETKQKDILWTKEFTIWMGNQRPDR